MSRLKWVGLQEVAHGHRYSLSIVTYPTPCASGRGATFRFFIEATLPKTSKSDPAGLGVERSSAVPRRIKALRRTNGSQDPRHVGVHILITEDNQVRLLRD